MKYLSDYQETKQSAVFDKFGAFFAFSQSQFNEQKKDEIKYISMGCGMVAPTYHADNLAHALKSIYLDAVQQDLKENGIKAIIHRELGNHECQISMSYDDVIDVLQDYGITREQIKSEWREYFQKCIDNDWF